MKTVLNLQAKKPQNKTNGLVITWKCSVSN